MATGTPIKDAVGLLKDGTEIGALGVILEQLNTPQVLEFEGARGEAGRVLLVPRGFEASSIQKYLDEALPAPRRRKGTATLRDQESFLAFVERFKSDHTVIYADPDVSNGNGTGTPKPQLQAVFNANPSGGGYTETGWQDHRAIYQPDISAEWQAWTTNDGEEMSQAEFAGFLEDRLAEIITVDSKDESMKLVSLLAGGLFATPSKLLELSRGLAVNVDMTVKEAVVLATGEINVQYTEQHTNNRGNPLKVPNLFAIQVPVFYAGIAYRIPAHLRYRVAGGRLTWWYKLVRPEKAFEDAFNEIIKAVHDGTSAPVFIGAPEKQDRS